MSSQLQVSGEAKIRDIQGPVVANSGVITALDGAASQYVRGDGTLADFPTSTGGGSSVSYYLNSSVSQGTIGGVAYRELSKDPIIGAGTDITISANGYVANYITDVNDPDVVLIPGGNFNCEFYFSVNNNSGNPFFYAELYKYDGTTFTLLGSSVGVPEYITQGTTIAPYYFAIPVATATLALTDRLAIRIYVNVSGRTITLHTENGHLCQVVTTLSKGMVSLNNLTDQSQFLAVGTSGTNFAIVSSGDTHTFNLPIASATNTGKLSSTDWSTFNGKVPYTGANANVDLGSFELNAILVKAITLEAKLNGTASGNLVLRTGTNGYGFGNNAFSLASSPDYDNTLLLISNKSAVTKTALFNINSLTADRTYTFPDVSGTLALTSDLSSYVPYTGANANVNLGVYELLAQNAFLNGVSGVNGGNLFLRQDVNFGQSAGYTTLYSTGKNLGFVSYVGSFTYNALFSLNSLTNNSTRTYTLPDASGTIALTSDISYPVTSVFGRTGAVVATSGDYTTTQVTEGTNLYYTDARSRAALSFTAGSGAYNSTTGVITIPTDNNQIANGAGYITSSALSGYLPLSGGTLTGGLNGTTATFSGLGTFYQLTMTGATAGRLFYAQTGGVFSQSGNLVWNNSTEQLGVGTPNPSAVVTAFSTNAATQLKAAGTAPAITFSNTLTSASLACVFGLATANNHFVTGTAPGDMAIANQSTSPGAIIFGTDTFEKMRMSSNGNFGIATSSPATKLDVSGTIRSISQTDPTSGVGMELFYRAADTSSYIQSYDRTNGAWKDVRIYGNTLYFGSQGTNNLTIASTGAATFSSSVTAASGLYNGYTSGLPPTSGSATRGGLRLNNASNIALDFGTVAAGQAWLQVSDANNYASNFALLLNPNGGNVGIGTSSPNNYGSSFTNLQVNGTTNGLVQVSGSSSTLASFYAGNGQGQIGMTSNHPFVLFTNDTERMRITSAGKVLIGTTSVSAQLSVNGAASSDGITSTIVSTGNTAFVSNVPASSYSAYWVCAGNTAGYISHPSTTTTTYYTGPSDLRLKSNINEWNESVLDLFSKVKPKTYNHIADNDESIVYKGFIAQEMVDKFPEAYQKDRDGYYANNPTGFIPYLVKAIQESHQIIKDLEARIVTLESKLN